MIVLLSVRRERNRLSAIGGRAKADGGANLHTSPSECQLFRPRRDVRPVPAHAGEVDQIVV